MKIYTIYKATNIVNNKVYIGFDSNWPKRMINHKTRSKNNQAKFYDAIRKYGWDNFVWEPIYQSLNLNHTKDFMETFFIKEYDSFNNGYNATLGGEGSCGHIKSKETQNRINNKLRGKSKPENFGKIISEALRNKSKTTKHKNNISLNHHNVEGENNPMYGKTHSLLTKNKQREKALSRAKISCLFCRKISDVPNFTRWHLNKCHFTQ